MMGNTDCKRTVLMGIALWSCASYAAAGSSSTVPDGWSTHSPRDEIRPRFDYQPHGGRGNSGAFVITHDDREGLDGRWEKTFPVRGGEYYRVRVHRKTQGVESPRQSALVRVVWRNDQGGMVVYDRKVVDYYRKGGASYARPNYPIKEKLCADGWTEVSGVFRAPSDATRLQVSLHLKWAPGGRIEYSDLCVEQTPMPAGRKVRLAAVHFQPRGGKSPMENCKMFEPLLQKAADQQADLVVLPETLTYFGLGKDYADVAEPVPGPSTEYFGQLAKKHDLYIVAGLIERDRHLAYNVAVLIGPDGKVVGKYRKVCLPRSEAEGGIAPGNDFPVFETRFGKVGMMVCYDGFFPKPARELTKRGAEVIAWPVWGCNPLLARARATENHVYLISSTYTAADTNWIVSGVYDHTGELLTVAKEFGDVVVTEVDLDKPTLWSGLGDFKAEMYRRRPN